MRKKTPAPVANPPCIGAGIDASINADVYAGFVDLLPRSTVDQQLAALLGDPSHAIDALAKATQDGDDGQAVYLAHQLKGTCMLMGFSAMTATVAQIEAACRRSAADTQDISSLLAQLQRDRVRTLAALPPRSGVPTLAR